MTLRVTVEIVPFGDESLKREIGRLNISNITYDRTRENEYGEISDYIVKGHRRSDGFWELVRKAIEEQPDER